LIAGIEGAGSGDQAGGKNIGVQTIHHRQAMPCSCSFLLVVFCQ